MIANEAGCARAIERLPGLPGLMHDIDFLTCPVCRTCLRQKEQILACEQGHTFDLAREGYVNLLRKKLPGDTKEMLLARRAFFDKGYYQALAEALNRLVNAQLSVFPMAETLHILDAGCGEGYYLGQLHTFLTQQSTQSTCVGIDIAKDAVSMAAKRYKEAFFIVANLREQLPLADQSMHILLNIFAPRNPEEYARVLVPQGILAIAIPGPQHLWQLRKELHLLNIEEQKQQHVLTQFAADFEVLTTQTVTYTMQLQPEEITQLVMMTPNYWHLSDETRLAMASIQPMETAAEFTCLLLRHR